MRAVIYARVSSEKQEREKTIEVQLGALRDYAGKEKLVIVKEYIDDGYSGTLQNRPGLDRLRDDAKNKLFDCILFDSPDRLARKSWLLGMLQEELKEEGIRVIFLNRPESKDTPEDNYFDNIQGATAQYVRDRFLFVTRRAKRNKALSGKIVGGKAPYGYRYIRGNREKGKSGHYQIDKKESETVKLIFNLFIKGGLSIRALAGELTSQGIKPRCGAVWRTSSLHRILKNETYTGVTYYNKHEPVETKKRSTGYNRKKHTSLRLRPKEDWIPIPLPDELKIIDRKTFDLVQRQLKINSELSPRNVKHRYLLRGLIVCGECESPFYGAPCHGRLFYRCGNRDRSFPLGRECGARMVRAEILENLVWTKFAEAIKNPQLISEQINKLNDRETKSKIGLSGDIKTIEKKIQGKEIEETRILDGYRAGAYSIERLKEQMNKIKEEKERLLEEQRITASEKNKTLYSTGDIKAVCKRIESRLEQFKNNFEKKRELLSLAINKVVIRGRTVKIRCIIPSYPHKNQGSLCPIASTSSGDYALRHTQPQWPFSQNFVPLPLKNQWDNTIFF